MLEMNWNFYVGKCRNTFVRAVLIGLQPKPYSSRALIGSGFAADTNFNALCHALSRWV